MKRPLPGRFDAAAADLRASKSVSRDAALRIIRFQPKWAAEPSLLTRVRAVSKAQTTQQHPGQRIRRLHRYFAGLVNHDYNTRIPGSQFKLLQQIQINKIKESSHALRNHINKVNLFFSLTARMQPPFPVLFTSSEINFDECRTCSSARTFGAWLLHD